MTDPIIEAVHADPIVQAVLSQTGAGSEAAPGAGAVTVERGTTTTTTTAGTMTSASGQLVAVPTSTEEEDRGTAGQRAVNMLWETTQATLALRIVTVVLAVAGLLSLAAMLPWASERLIALAITAFMLLSSLSTLVIGFYYGRTNHQKVGGVMQGR